MNVLKRLWLFLLLNFLFKYYEKESQVRHNSYRVGYQIPGSRFLTPKKLFALIAQKHSFTKKVTY